MKTKHKHQYKLGRSGNARVCSCGAFKHTTKGLKEGGGPIAALNGPKFEVSLADRELIQSIRARAVAILKAAEVSGGQVYDALSIEMDLTACHASGTPLRLRDLLAAEKFDFIHDIMGINRHLNRETGKLGGCFLPRFAVKKGAAS